MVLTGDESAQAFDWLRVDQVEKDRDGSEAVVLVGADHGNFLLYFHGSLDDFQKIKQVAQIALVQPGHVFLLLELFDDALRNAFYFLLEPFRQVAEILLVDEQGYNDFGGFLDTLGEVVSSDLTDDVVEGVLADECV